MKKNASNTIGDGPLINRTYFSYLVSKYTLPALPIDDDRKKKKTSRESFVPRTDRTVGGVDCTLL